MSWIDKKEIAEISSAEGKKENSENQDKNIFVA
jgi:hypothetical protein